MRENHNNYDNRGLHEDYSDPGTWNPKQRPMNEVRNRRTDTPGPVCEAYEPLSSSSVYSNDCPITWEATTTSAPNTNSWREETH